MWILLKERKCLSNSTFHFSTGLQLLSQRASTMKRRRLVSCVLWREKRHQWRSLAVSVTLFFLQCSDLIQYPPQTCKAMLLANIHSWRKWSFVSPGRQVPGDLRKELPGTVEKERKRPPIILSFYAENHEHTNWLCNLFQMDFLSHGRKLWPTTAYTFSKQVYEGTRILSSLFWKGSTTLILD